MPKPVYDDVLTRASEERLRGLVAGIPHPVAIAGGHGVLHNVRERWRRRFHQDYFGSRDIDVIYFIDPTWTRTELEASAAAQAPARIERLGYKPIAYRYQQILDKDGRVLEQEPGLAIEDFTVFRLYIDPMVTARHDHLPELWRSPSILDEPLLAPVFTDPTARFTLPQFGGNVYLPTPPYLVATKLRSHKTRTDDKAVKDLCDLYALAAYGGADPLSIRRVVHLLLPDAVSLVQGALTSDHLPKALDHLDLGRNEFQAVIGPIAVRP